MILIQRYLTICKFFLLKKRKKYWNELFQVENPVEFYFISRVHIPAIVSLHPQFTLSYHLPPRTISISQVAPLGSAKMLISLSTDRDVDVQNGTIYIYRHARVVKERRSVAAGPCDKKLRRNSRAGWNFSRFLASGLSDKLHFRAGIGRFSR